MEQNAYGEEVLKNGAPDFEDWYNSMVAPSEQISSGLTSKQKDKPKNLTPEEIALGRESFNTKGGADKANDYWPGNEANDDEAKHEAYLLRNKASQQAPGLLKEPVGEAVKPQAKQPESNKETPMIPPADVAKMVEGRIYKLGAGPHAGKKVRIVNGIPEFI